MQTAKGDIKEAAGKAVGSAKLKSKGLAEQSAGKVRAAAGDIRVKAASAAKEALDR